jgi:hypothetical protein
MYLKFKAKFSKERLDICKEREGLSVGKSNLQRQVEKYCLLLSNLNKIWHFNEYRGKLELHELLFPQGIVYDRKNDSYRTPEINEVIRFCPIGEGFSKKKIKGT